MSSQPKTILTNTLAQLVAKGVAVLLTLLSTTYIIRLGGPSLFGDLTKILALTAIGFTAIDFGLNAQAVRTMRGSLEEREQILASTFLARLILSLAALIILNLLVAILPGGYSGEIRSVFWLGSLSIIFQGLYTSANAWFQRHLEYWKSSLAVIAGTTVATALTLFFLSRGGGLVQLTIASTIGYLAMALLSLFLVRSHLPSCISLAGSLHYLRSSLGLGGILILSILATKIDSVILGVTRTPGELGEYAFAYRIFDVALTLPVFVMNTVYPLLVDASTLAKAHLIRTSLKYLFVIGTLGALLMYPLAPLIYLVKPGLTLSVASFRILLISLPLFYLTAPLMWQLIEARRERSLLILYALAALFNGVLNLVLIPHYGALASAALTGATELFILLGLVYLRS